MAGENEFGLGGIDDLSLEAALHLYDTYVRYFTNFKLQHLENPKVYDISRLTLPKRSTYHFVDMQGLQTGPQYSDPLLQAVPGPKLIEHIQRLVKPEGTPIKIPGVNTEMMITDYRRFNRMIRPTLDPLKQDQDERNLIIYNYSLIVKTWRYAANFRAEYYRWSNVYRVIVDKLISVTKTSVRNQFLDMDLPDRIPAISKLREFDRTKSSESLKYLRQEGDLMIAELFSFLGENKSNSIFSTIPADSLKKINLIVRRNSSWSIINLGWLVDVASRPGMTPKLIQAKFLMMLNRILDASAILDESTTDEVEEPEDDKTGKSPLTSNKDIEEDENEVTNLQVLLKTGFTDDTDVKSDLLDDVTELAATEKELEELDRIREQADAEVLIENEDEDSVELHTVSKYAVDGFSHGETQPAILAKADELLGKGSITPAAYKRLLRASDRFNAIPDPYGSDKTISEAMVITEDEYLVEEQKFSDDPVLLDPKMGVSRIDSYQEKYIEHALKKDVLASICAIQNFPVSITDYRVVDKTDALNTIEEHVFKIIPAVGEPSVGRIQVMKIDKDGTFMYSGKRYRTRGQRADLPIRKISPTDVVLSSYAGKCFVKRSSRSKFNYAKWIKTFLVEEATNVDTTVFTSPVLSTVVDYSVKLPWMYTTIASVMSSFVIDKISYNFDYKRRVDRLNLQPHELKLEKHGSVIIARYKNGVLLMKDDGEIVHVVDGVEEPFSDFETMLRIGGKKPFPMAELKIFGKEIPVGICLGYLIGLNPLLKLLRAKVRRVLPGERMSLEPYEFALRFKNEILVIDGRDRRTVLIMSGWQQLEATTKQFDVGLFDSPDVYMPVLDRAGIPSRYLKELDAFNSGFLDPMTKDLLREMGEPTEYVPLVIRAVELILDEYVPSKRDDPNTRIELTERIRGYERVPGMIYESLFKAMRTYAARANRSDAKVVVNPIEALTWLVSDPTTSIVNNINPVHSLREREVLTFGGRYGRSKRAMVANTRLYQEGDKGFISEATVDSGDVGVITYLSPNSNVTTIRGTIRSYDEKRDGRQVLLSSASQLMPGSDGDAPKRLAFIPIQLGHQISTIEMDLQSYRTGGERAMIGRMNKEFGGVAKADGKVVEIDKDHIVVEYKDGSSDRYRIGDIEVSAEGTYYPHKLSSILKEGDKVKKGDVLFYNANFFVPDPIEKGKVNYSLGLNCYTAFREANYTIEDSCSISENFSKRMQTVVTKVVSKVVNFDQEIVKMIKPGSEVDLDSVLLQTRDEMAGDVDEDELAKALELYTQHSLKAGVVGVVNGFEVFYNGEVEEMSETLRKLTNDSERRRKEDCKFRGETFYPNKVHRNVRIDGMQVESRQAIIVFHISLTLGMGVSDKLVFASQLKSTVGQVLFGSNTTLEGEELDAIFGALSGINRTVTSVYKQGGVNTYLRYVGEDAYALWKS